MIVYGRGQWWLRSRHGPWHRGGFTGPFLRNGATDCGRVITLSSYVPITARSPTESDDLFCRQCVIYDRPAARKETG